MLVPTTMERTQAILVPTIRTKPSKELDIGRMSESDLERLRRTDPFMYHSIPAKYRANLSLERTDPSRAASSVASSVASSAREEASSDDASSRSSSGSVVVRRRSQLTTEFHDSVHLKDLIEDEGFAPRDVPVPPDLAALFGSPSDVQVPADLAALLGSPSGGSGRKRKQ